MNKKFVYQVGNNKKVPLLCFTIHSRFTVMLFETTQVEEGCHAPRVLPAVFHLVTLGFVLRPCLVFVKTTVSDHGSYKRMFFQ